MRKILIFAATAFLLLSLWSCSSNGVVLDPTLSIEILGGDISLNAGQENTFIAEAKYNGTGKLTYSWYVYDTKAATTSTSLIFTGNPTSTTQYPIKVTVTDGVLTAVDSIIATVTP